mmetsp:Transcript_25324/g.26381  ORF Transcript_25324/g.26381 Transcript_25324/m.26381 type:complete len:86 (+) Transcript_25324:77-334(+)
MRNANLGLKIAINKRRLLANKDRLNLDEERFFREAKGQAENLAHSRNNKSKSRISFKSVHSVKPSDYMKSKKRIGSNLCFIPFCK